MSYRHGPHNSPRGMTGAWWRQSLWRCIRRQSERMLPVPRTRCWPRGIKPMPQADRPSRRVPHEVPVSVCLVVHNEGQVIERCMRSLAGLEAEIVVVHDGPCTDDTLDIARRYNARVFVRPFAGHSEHHRPFAYQRARGEWLPNVDAGEFLSPEMAAVRPELRSRWGMAGSGF